MSLNPFKWFSKDNEYKNCAEVDYSAIRNTVSEKIDVKSKADATLKNTAEAKNIISSLREKTGVDMIPMAAGDADRLIGEDSSALINMINQISRPSVKYNVSGEIKNTYVKVCDDPRSFDRIIKISFFFNDEKIDIEEKLELNEMHMISVDMAKGLAEVTSKIIAKNITKRILPMVAMKMVKIS